MGKEITNYSNGWRVGYNNDDFIRNEVTYYKDFDCGSKYGNFHCRMFFKNRIITIVLSNQYKIYKSYSIELFSKSYMPIDLILTDLYNDLLKYENNIHKATS
jgi:hypothetical protein